MPKHDNIALEDPKDPHQAWVNVYEATKRERIRQQKTPKPLDEKIILESTCEKLLKNKRQSLIAQRILMLLHQNLNKDLSESLLSESDTSMTELQLLLTLTAKNNFFVTHIEIKEELSKDGILIVLSITCNGDIFKKNLNPKKHSDEHRDALDFIKKHLEIPVKPGCSCWS